MAILQYFSLYYKAGQEKAALCEYSAQQFFLFHCPHLNPMMRDTWKKKYLCLWWGRKEKKKIRKEQEKTETHEPAPWTTTNALGKSKCRSTAASDKICMFTSSALLFPRLQSIFTKGERIPIASRSCKAVIAKMDSLIVSSSVFCVIAAPPIKKPWNTKFSKPKTKHTEKIR